MNTFRHRQPIRFNDALGAARLWASIGGRREVELGALEPLLWKDGERQAPDLVRGLASLGFRVTMTTNGSLLAQFAPQLRDAGLSLLRISWHTTDAVRYHQMSGRGDYDTFQRGIEAAAQAGLPVSFNRVLLKGFTHDVPDQLDFIERHGLRLKLYDLMWTPEIAAQYESFYQDWRPVIRDYVLPRTVNIERRHGGVGRNRLRFYLGGGARVEVKIGDHRDRSKSPCATCRHKGVCLEEFGDYLRVEPELDAYFCYLRRDLGLRLPGGHEDCARGGADVLAAIRQHLGDNCETFVALTPLRLIVTPYCNYNCFFPGTTLSWCHKTSGDYSFPGKPVVAQRVVAASVSC